MVGRKILAVTVILLSGLPILQSSASVLVIGSGGELIEVGGVSYTRVNVKCKSTRESRKISQFEGSQKWCAGESQNVCESKKLDAAKLVCARSYKQPINVKRNTAKPESNKVEAAIVKVSQEKSVNISEEVDGSNKLTIQEQKFLIEERKLEILQMELDLKKKELGLN